MKNIETSGVWIAKKVYDDAETAYYESQTKASLTPLAEEVAKARQRLIDSRNNFTNVLTEVNTVDPDVMKFTENHLLRFQKAMDDVLERIRHLDLRVAAVEKHLKTQVAEVHEIKISPSSTAHQEIKEPEVKDDKDDHFDLFSSSGSEEDEATAKIIKEERLAEYRARRAKKKTVVIAKSNIIFDIKPWDDETDMKEMEEEVRDIKMDGLLWGTGKLVPLAYGIKKLQITCVVEDEKVSVDLLEEKITDLHYYVQSVDIVAFNKI